MLTQSQTKRLERIALRDTAYELIMTDGKDTYLVCYACRKSRQGILSALRDKSRVNQILSLTPERDDFTWLKPASSGCILGRWTIKFSGRTQRECILSTEHPYVGNIVVNK